MPCFLAATSGSLQRAGDSLKLRVGIRANVGNGRLADDHNYAQDAEAAPHGLWRLGCGRPRLSTFRPNSQRPFLLSVLGLDMLEEPVLNRPTSFWSERTPRAVGCPESDNAAVRTLMPETIRDNFRREISSEVDGAVAVAAGPVHVGKLDGGGLEHGGQGLRRGEVEIGRSRKETRLFHRPPPGGVRTVADDQFDAARLQKMGGAGNDFAGVGRRCKAIGNRA